MKAAGRKIVPYTMVLLNVLGWPLGKRNTDDESRLDKTNPVINSYTFNPELMSE
jgi:hypothetical protein